MDQAHGSGEGSPVSYEDQAEVRTVVLHCGPWMTRDEMRAQMDLPPLGPPEGDELMIPLNVRVVR